MVRIPGGGHRRLERGRCEVVLLGPGSDPEPVADPDLGETVQPADLASDPAVQRAYLGGAR